MTKHTISAGCLARGEVRGNPTGGSTMSFSPRAIMAIALALALTVGLAAWLFRHVPFATLPLWLLACLLAYAAGVFHRTWRIPC